MSAAVRPAEEVAVARRRWHGCGLLLVAALLTCCGAPAPSPAPAPTTAASATSSPSVAAAARIAATKKIDSRTVDLMIESRAGGGKVRGRLPLPATFPSQPPRRWPVLYLLHGC